VSSAHSGVLREAPVPESGPGASLVLPGPIRAAVFDMDGVLIDTEPLWLAAETELLERHGDRLTAADAEATHGRSIEDTVAVYAARLDGAVVAAIRDELLAAMRVHYAAAPPLRPGARDLVEALGRRMPLGVASNTDGDLVRLALEGAGLLGAFAVIASGADIGRAKPYPDVYLAACHGLGVEPGLAVAVEDSPAGVRAAKAAGMMCIGVPDRDGVDLMAAGADLVVASLVDLLGLALG
jgi:HAD superfamily hydrolase (TIGR01509 family)